MSIDHRYAWQMKEILSICTYDNNIPLGLVTSPILSDIYMKDFDEKIELYINSYNITYTRYADDILFSKEEPFTEEEKESLKDFILKELHNKKLKLNEEKYKEINLEKEGDHIKYLGLNIVKGNMSNRITVGKTYVYSIAKEYIKYLHMNNDSELEKQQKYYKGKELAGKISFLRNIEGETGYRMLVERIRISTKGIVCITEDKIQFE